MNRERVNGVFDKNQQLTTRIPAQARVKQTHEQRERVCMFRASVHETHSVNSVHSVHAVHAVHAVHVNHVTESGS